MTHHAPEPKLAVPIYGRNLLESLPGELFDRALVYTQPEPWELVKKFFIPEKTDVRMVNTMDLSRIEAEEEKLPAASAVFGIGGGMALDRAKFSAWKKGMPLVLVPGILSVDAPFTREIAVRQESRVRYIGCVVPDFLLIDYEILQQAPRLLNKSGIGDLISIFTALWDWKEAAMRLGERYEPETATRALVVLERMFDGAGSIKEMNEQGLHLLSELFAEEVRLCAQFGNSRPEEGSEHYLAYCLESITQRPYIHGQLISLCVLLAARRQGQDILPVTHFLEEIEMDPGLDALKISRSELVRALVQIKEYLGRESQLLPGVFHFRAGLSQQEAGDLIDSLAPVIGA